MKKVLEKPAGYEHWQDKEKRSEEGSRYLGAPTAKEHPLNDGSMAHLGFKKGSIFYKDNGYE